MYTLIVTTQSEEQLLVDTRLLALWDDYSPNEFEKPVERPTKFAYLDVLATVSPLPRPSRDAIALPLSGGSSPGGTQQATFPGPS